MTLRTNKTPGRSIVHVEAPRHNELAVGVAVSAGTDEPPVPVAVNRSAGRVADRQSAAALGRLGGLAKAAQVAKLDALVGLGLRDVGLPASALQPFLRDAEDFAEHEIKRLAEIVGGGHCGASPSAMVQSAALQLAASRYLFSLGGDPAQLKLASMLANDSRQNLLAAHHICALEAKARPRENSIQRLERRMGLIK